MKAIEYVIDEMVIDKTGERTDVEIVKDFIVLSISYVEGLIELRPLRALKLMRVKDKLEKYNKQIEVDGLGHYLYWDVIETLSNVHRTGKEIKRQMKQQFGETPDYLDLSESLWKEEKIDAKYTLNKLKGRD